MFQLWFSCEKTYPHVSFYQKCNTVQFRLKQSQISDFEKNATSPWHWCLPGRIDTSPMYPVVARYVELL